MAKSKSRQPITQEFINKAQVFGDYWTILIIKILTDQELRFNQLISELPGITNRTLSMRLKSLYLQDIVTRTVTNDNPPFVLYSLTEKGKSFGQIANKLDAMQI